MSNKNEIEFKDLRDAFFDEVSEFAFKNKDFYIITNDMDVFSLQKLRKEKPNQFINVGVAEQNMINVAAGLSATGKKVLIFGIASFIILRCYEQIKMNICSMKLPVILAGIGTGFSFSYDGPTHHATNDLSIARSLPEIDVYSPGDVSSAKFSALSALRFESASYCRIDKGMYPNYLLNTNSNMESLGWNEICKLKKINIMSHSYMVQKCHEVVKELDRENIELGLVNIFRIKPIHKDSILEIIKKSKLIITIEENSIINGLGSIISELITDNSLETKLLRLGLSEEQALYYGTRDYMLSRNNLEISQIKKSILSAINKIK
jgi:transketolase